MARLSVASGWTQATDSHGDQTVEQGRLFQLRRHILQHRANYTAQPLSEQISCQGRVLRGDLMLVQMQERQPRRFDEFPCRVVRATPHSQVQGGVVTQVKGLVQFEQACFDANDIGKNIP